MIALLIAIGAIVAVKLNVHTLHNPRALGGANVDVTPAPGSQEEASFAIDARHPERLFGADNALSVSTSTDAGRTWTHREYPALTRFCTHRDPRVAVDAAGRQYIAFVASSLCEDELTPHVVVASRASATSRWRVVRVAKPTWEYGYDDAPAIALDARGRVYVAWTRSLGESAEAVVVAASGDHGATWSRPVVVDPARARPHLAQLAVGASGDVYAAGIDVPHGVWAVRSTDGGRTFGSPTRLAPLAANPADECARTGETPVANEARTCVGPNPTLATARGRVYVVYADFGGNKTQDVYVDAADAALKRLFRAAVTPPDHGRSQQLLPTSAADATTGRLWACWYDTTYDSSGKKAWFTCAHSSGGRTWSAPERAAAVPTELDWLYVTYGHGGLQPSLAARGGIAHAFWIDGRRPSLLDDVFTARLRG